LCLKPSTPFSLACFIHWLTAPSVTPRAWAICVCFQPCSFSSKARKRLPSRQSLAWLDNVFSIVEYSIPLPLHLYAEISMLARWRFMVASERCSEMAISWLLIPRATMSTTSSSRAERPSASAGLSNAFGGANLCLARWDCLRRCEPPRAAPRWWRSLPGRHGPEPDQLAHQRHGPRRVTSRRGRLHRPGRCKGEVDVSRLPGHGGAGKRLVDADCKEVLNFIAIISALPLVSLLFAEARCLRSLTVDGDGA